MSDLAFVSSFSNNVLVILDGLGDDDQQNGRWLEESVNDLSNKLHRPGYCTRFRVYDAKELHATLKLIETDCKTGTTKPVLHFECHGDLEKGLFLARSGEYVGWQTLLRLISGINIASRNNTGLVLASCNGFEITKLVRINEPCSFHFALGPDTSVTAGELKEEMTAFYRMIMATNNLNAAIAELKPHYKRFLCTEWLYLNFASFVVTNFSGKAKAAMAEKILDNLVAMRSGRHLKDLRKRVKKHIKTPEITFQDVSKTFLHSKKPVSYAQFEAFVKQTH
ncbi:hypothetical protein GNF76_25545 [Pseudomonas sp. CCM 7893]|uniref:Uncharacterized protein n=1 Tax=Pseudomonas spelaei TaxID=1055469 RepID=A0A6I3WHG4_9PSED|nr:hypothetical protein [Pseudomonas spelaei]MUF07721.1 hypothetical protein [Pseudomonas spelaei]